MSTIRREGLDFTTEFTMMPNRWLRDGRLSLKAAALLMLLLSHRAGWVTSIRQLAADRLEGRESIMAGIAELERYGYLKRERVRNEKGQLVESVWTILDPDANPGSENPTLGSEWRNPRPEPQSGFPTLADPDTANPTTKKTKVKKTNPEENQGNGPAAATEAQRDYLKDLHRHGGGAESGDVNAWIDGLTAAEANAQIKEALAALPRGRDYAGDPDNPHFTWKGREVAAARMIPGGTPPRSAPEPEAVLF